LYNAKENECILYQTKVRETAAIETLTNIERERDALKNELEALEAEARELDKMEERYMSYIDANGYSL